MELKVASFKVYFLSLLLITAFLTPAMSQCPAGDGSDMFDTTFPIGSITIPVSDCTVTNGGTVNSTLSITIPNGAILTINANFSETTWFTGGGVITVENGGQLIINGNFNLAGAADLDIQDGGYVSVTGNVTFGGVFSGDATVDGDLDVGGDLTLNGTGSLSGDGSVDVTGDVVDNGGDSSGFTGDQTCGGASCDPLPVELISFNAQSFSNDKCLVEWSTVSELNNEGFHVEKSLDGEDFNEIGFVYGNGTTQIKQEYTFTDNYFYEGAFYRLRQVDFDGQFEYHEIVYAKHSANREVSLRANPVITSFVLDGSNELNYTVSLVTISGQQISYFANQKLDDIENSLNELVGSLTPSVYILRIQSAQGQQAIRFIKK